MPALGDVYQRLVRAIEAGDSDHEQLADIVCEDVALTAEILRLLNSAFFGLRRRIESVGQAIGLLGTDVLRAIVAGYSVFNHPDSLVIDADTISRRSQQVAALARRCYQTLAGASRADLAAVYLAGMLHEVGALVLGTLDDLDPAEVRAVLDSNDTTVERLVFGADRFAVSGHLLERWDFPAEIVDAVSSLGGRVEPSANPMTWSLAVARHIVVNNLAADTEADTDGDNADGPSIEELIHSVDAQLRAAVPPTPIPAPVGATAGRASA